MPSPVTLKIKFKSASLQQFIERYSVDVSKGGIFIRTPKPLAVGTALKFEFQLQDGSQLITGNGTVVWIRESDPDKAGVAPGMGVRFDFLPPDSQKVLDQVLAQKQQAMEFSDQPTRVASPTDASAMAEASEPEPQPKPAPRPEVVAPLPAAPPPEPEPEPEPEPPPPVRAAEPPPKAVEPAPPEEEPESARKERLAKILFSSDETPQPTDEPPPRYPDSDDLEPSPVVEERKSSAVGWIVIVLLIGVCVAAYFLFLHKPSKPTTAAKPDATPTVQAGKDSTPTPASKPAGVTQKVTSEPEGAKILVDGKDTGKVTPADLDLEPEKEVEIRLDLPGKKLFTKKVTPNAEAAVEAKLDKPSARRVQLVSDPAGAMVLLNGMRLGKAPLDYKKPLPKGKVEVIFRLDGYNEAKKDLAGEQTWTREGEDEVLSVSVTLEKKEGAAPQPQPKIKRQPKPKPEPKDDDGDKPEPKAKKPEPKAKKPEPKAKKPEPKDVPDVTPDTKKKIEKKKAEPKDDGDKPDPDTKKGGVKKPSWSD
jgi:uncharacterized protein (TIGR02266 family)